MRTRPLGPALGIAGSFLIASALMFPWLMIEPGGGFGRPLGIEGWPAKALAGCAIALLVVTLASTRVHRSLRVVQIGLACAAVTVVVLACSSPLTEAFAEQAAPNESFVVWWGPKLAILGALVAILGAIATATRRSAVPVAE